MINNWHQSETTEENKTIHFTFKTNGIFVKSQSAGDDQKIQNNLNDSRIFLMLLACLLDGNWRKVSNTDRISAHATDLSPRLSRLFHEDRSFGV